MGEVTITIEKRGTKVGFGESVRMLNADKSPFQRTFVNQVKRCAEMSRKLRFFKDQIHKAGLLSSAHPAMQQDVELEELEIQLADHEHELIEMNNNSEKLQQTYNELLEFKMVLQKALAALGLKTGGTIQQRADRLFLTKGWCGWLVFSPSRCLIFPAPKPFFVETC